MIVTLYQKCVSRPYLFIACLLESLAAIQCWLFLGIQTQCWLQGWERGQKIQIKNIITVRFCLKTTANHELSGLQKFNLKSVTKINKFFLESILKNKLEILKQCQTLIK